MKQIAMLVCSISTILIFNGCCCKDPLPPQIVYVPQKCVIPKVDDPKIDNTKYIHYEDIIGKGLLNYLAIKQYAKKLLASQKVCE